MDAKDIAEELQDTVVVEPEDSQESKESHPEKMLTASQVNVLIQKAKRKGEQKMQEQLEAARQEIEQLKAQQPQQQQAQVMQQQQPQGVDVNALQQHVMQGIQQQMQEEQKRREQEQIEQEVNQVAQQYFGKMAQGKDLHEDFEAITADFNPAEFPELVFMANQLDNTASVIYEIRKNPGKLADLVTLMGKSPSMAKTMLGNISDSIKRNDEAKRNLQEAQDPLNRLKPSPVGTDSGTKSVRDYKNASFLRV